MQKVFIFIMFFISGCGMFDSTDPVPMFLELDSATFEARPGEGGSTSKIQDASVFVDGNTVGVFELPATVPILSNDGQVDVSILAGIRNNGQQLKPKEYPFYNPLNFQLDFQELETVPLELNYNYNENIAFDLLENFESTNVFGKDLDADSTTFLFRSQDALYGQYCGQMDVPADALFLQTTFETKPTNVFGFSQVYLEMDYKCSIMFIVGYTGIDDSGVESTDFFYVFREQPEWDKIYIDLSSQLNGNQFVSYQLIIAGAPDQPAGSIWVDNVKLAYLP